MRVGTLLERFWRQPPTREGRNEQRKALASLFNAAAITLLVTGFFGPWINPVLEATLSPGERAILVLMAGVTHAIARAVLWSLEDRA